MTPDALFADNRRLAYHLVRLFRRRYPVLVSLADYEDQIQDAELALWRVANYYDPEAGAVFSTYAGKAVFNAVVDAVLKRRRPSLSRHHFDEEQYVPAIAPDELESRDFVETMLSTVRERVRLIVIARLRGDTFPEIAERLGLTRQRVRQLWLGAIDVMREAV